MSYLDQFVDPDYDPDHSWTPAEQEEHHKDRLTRLCAVVSHSLAVPRRLGGEASPAELAADKKVAKRMLNRAQTLLRSWGGQPADYEELMQHDDSTHVDGAQIVWEKWWADHKAYLDNCIRITATTATKLGYVKQGNAYVNRLVNERNMFEDVLDG